MKYIFSLVILLLVMNNNVKSQIDDIVGAIAGVAVSAIEINEFYESLELLATNFVLESRPEEQAFEVKVLKLDGKKHLTDISDESVIIYSVVFFDLITSEIKSKETLFMITSPGWVNSFGMNISLQEWLWVSEDKWFKMYHKFVNIATPMDLSIDSVPVVACLSEAEFTNSANQFKIAKLGKSKSVSYYEYLDFYVDVNSIVYSIEHKSFDYNRRMLPQHLQHKACELPHYDINRDTYIVASYDAQISLVVNEGSFGIFMKSTSQLLQIRRSVLRDIQRFYFQVDSYDKRFELSEDEIESQIIDKIAFQIGDKGKIEVGRNIWVPFEIIKLKNEDDDCPVLRISFSTEEGVPNDKWIICDNDELIWI